MNWKPVGNRVIVKRNRMKATIEMLNIPYDGTGTIVAVSELGTMYPLKVGSIIGIPESFEILAGEEDLIIIKTEDISVMREE